MADDQDDKTARGGVSESTRRFGPLTGIIIAAVLAFAVFPSALTLPNTNPSTQLELAPVPQSDNNSNKPVSNFTALDNPSGPGLGSGNGGGGGKGPGAKPTASASAAPSSPVNALPPPPGAGNHPPATYDCIAGRQTEDPLAPPCVPFYQGDNGGSTYQGVTATSLNILIYFDPNGTTNTARGTDSPPYGTIVDLASPSSQKYNNGDVIVNRSWMYYFNKRYATYNRFAHVFVQFGTYNDQAVETAGTQASDAAYGYAKVKPFAVINYSDFGNGAYYDEYMAQHNVLIFGSASGRSQSFYQQYAGLQWGYLPPIERAASQYAQFVCNSLVSRPADEVGSGLTVKNGTPRKFGFVYTTDPDFASITEESMDALKDIKSLCNATPADTATFPKNSYATNTQTVPTYATNAMAKFQTDGITTVLWPAGYEANFSKAATAERYAPEWILGDDSQQEDGFDAQFQDQVAWAHAYIVSSITYLPGLDADQLCQQAYRTVDPNAADSDVSNFACPEYNDLRQLFTGIQVAGPHLTPQTINTGFHAIPQTVSTNREVPACFYDPGDYTCVKDSSIEFWDTTGKSQQSSQPGCWRMVGSGKRFVPGNFPKANLADITSRQDVCNNFYNVIHQDLNTPGS